MSSFIQSQGTSYGRQCKDEGSSRSQEASTYLQGLWQEEIVWTVINEFWDGLAVEYSVVDEPTVDVKHSVTWKGVSNTYTLRWFKPNTHPIYIGSISKPEFGLLVNGIQVANIESKNWHVKYKPMSYYDADKLIISRFRHVVSKQSILIISELRLEDGDSQQIRNLLNDWHVKVILTHRKADGFHDKESYQMIKNQLEPMLTKIVNEESV